jgi:uncharacterized protein (TIGR02246 family)
MNLKLAPLAVLAALAATPASAQALTPEELIHRHLDFMAKGDADGIANDFAPDGAAVFGATAAVGREAIRAQFAKMVAGPVARSIKADKIWSEKNVGFLQWEAGPVHGVDVFVIHDNKISSQSAFVAGPPAPPPGAGK